jgi:hypothetical protein
MNLFDFSEVDFSQPEVVASLARAYAVLIAQAKRRKCEAPRLAEERLAVDKERKLVAAQEQGVVEQLRLF